MNKAPDGYIKYICDRCGARFTNESNAREHGCGWKYIEDA